jgi:lambda repressor-like predicted transcriptional regulator
MTLTEIQKEIKYNIPIGLDTAFELLKKFIKHDRPIFDEVILQESRHRSAQSHFRNNLITLSEFNLITSQITSATINITNSLEQDDIEILTIKSNEADVFTQNIKVFKKQPRYKLAGLYEDFIDAFNELFSKDIQIKQIEFCENDGWIILTEDRRVIFNRIPSGLHDKILELSLEKNAIKQFLLLENSGWVILLENNNFWCNNVPPSLFDDLNSAWKRNNIIEKICYFADGWIFLFGNRGYFQRNMPVELMSKIDDYHDDNIDIINLFTTRHNGWVLVTESETWSTNNLLPTTFTNSLGKAIDKGEEIINMAISVDNSWILITNAYVPQ